MSINLGHWEYGGEQEIPESFYGFIYIIVNKVTNKKYIGKKQCVSHRTKKPLKGKKNKRHVTKESDWRTYTGSNKTLNEDINNNGISNFNFYIIKFCQSKWELAYEEIKLQLQENVLLSENYYNGIINVRIGRPPATLKNNY